MNSIHPLYTEVFDMLFIKKAVNNLKVFLILFILLAFFVVANIGSGITYSIMFKRVKDILFDEEEYTEQIKITQARIQIAMKLKIYFIVLKFLLIIILTIYNITKIIITVLI